MKKTILIALLFIVGTFLFGCATTKTTDVFRFEVRELEITLYNDANTRQENDAKLLKLIRGDIDDNAVIVYTTTILSGENAGKVEMDNGVIEVVGSNVNKDGYPTTKGVKDIVSVYPIAAGSVRFSAYIEGQENVCDSIIITVVNEKISAFKVSSESSSIFVGTTTTLTSSAIPSYIDAEMFNFSSSDTSIATVDENGVVKGVNAGAATITAYSKYDPSMYSSTTISVRYAQSGSIIVSKDDVNVTAGSKINMVTGEKVTFSTETLPSDSSLSKESINQMITCESAPKDIVKTSIKNNNGVYLFTVEALKAGTTEITVKSNDKKTTFKFNIEVAYDKATDLILENDNYELKVDKSLTVNATVSPTSANPNVVISGKTDADSALVSINGNVVKAVAPGTATLVVSTIQPDGSDPITKEITVVITYDTLESIALSTKELKYVHGVDADKIALGHTISVNVTPSGANKEFTYVSDNETIATVDANGVVTINDVVGTAKITVTSVENTEITAELTISIIPEPEEISVDGAYEEGHEFNANDDVTFVVSILPAEANQSFDVEIINEGDCMTEADRSGNKISLFFDPDGLGTFKIVITVTTSTGDITWERTYSVKEAE